MASPIPIDCPDVPLIVNRLCVFIRNGERSAALMQYPAVRCIPERKRVIL